MPELTELTGAECPLLRDAPALKAADLIGSFNQLVKQFRDLGQGEFAYLLNRDDFRAIADDVLRVRGQLTRPRYRVGFLGTSQAGKSTTFNNVLQEVIAQSGIGDATTSIITRTQRVAGKPDVPRRFTLRFLTQPQYMERRERLCKALHILNAGAKSNQEILEFLSDPKRLAAAQSGAPENAGEETELARNRRNRTGDHGFLPDDVPYLRDYLRAYDAHHARYVVKTGPAKEMPGDFANRARYLNHAFDESGPPSENLLLFEAEIATPNPNIPPQLEAIDCPGLGSKRSVDTIQTKEFLPHLDGALIFLRADQLRSKDVVEVLEILKTNFGKLEGRVWVVVNKFDGLAREHLYGDVEGRTVFDLIRLFLTDYQIPPEQIVFTSKRVFELAGANGGKAPQEQTAMLLGVAPQEPIPPRCKADRVLSSAFQHLLDDGGIAHLRRLILETISDAVSVQISAAAKREIQLLQEEFTHKVEVEHRRVKGGKQQRDDAILCHDTVQELLHELGTRTEFFRPLADHLREKLHERLLPNEQRVRVIMNMPVEQLAMQFKVHAETMEQELDELMNADVIDRLYNEVAEKMEHLPPVAVSRCAGGPYEAWQQFRKEDRDPKGWRSKTFPSFFSKELFAGLTRGEVHTGFDGEKYIDMMRDKIRVATQQVMHAVRVQMRRRLRTLERELALLIYRPEENN